MRTHPAAGAHVIFTDIDGTLADAGTFDVTPARSALRRLRAMGVPVVPVTSMTLAEMEPIASDMGYPPAMIIESGGAIARCVSSGWEVEPLGPDAESLLDVICQIEERSGADLVVYSALSSSEAAMLSGLSGEKLQRSTDRRFSEPFVIAAGDPARVANAARTLGFSLCCGRRFLYLPRLSDDGKAFRRLRSELNCRTAIALGDAPANAEFLSRADIPIVIPRADGTPDPDLLKIGGVRVAPAPGTAGWVAAIEEVLQPETRSIAATSPSSSFRSKAARSSRM